MESENKNSVKTKRRKRVNRFMLIQQTINLRNSFSKKISRKNKCITYITMMLYQLATTVKKENFKSLKKKNKYRGEEVSVKKI